MGVRAYEHSNIDSRTEYNAVPKEKKNEDTFNSIEDTPDMVNA
jgi:hypothetical protein